MVYDLAFEMLHLYDAGKSGITIPVLLCSGGLSVDVTTKLDTGASDCIFERFYGEELKLDIESGSRREFSAATGTFLAYGHEATLSVLGFDFRCNDLLRGQRSFQAQRARSPWISGSCAARFE